LAEMLRDETVAFRTDGSSVQLRDSVAERSAERVSHDAAPSNDVDGASFPPLAIAQLQERLCEVLEGALREPLSSIVAVSSGLQQQLGDAHTAQLQSIVAAAERTDGMLRDLHEFLQGGLDARVTIRRRRVNLKLLCERVVDALQRSHPEHPIALTCDSRVEGDWDPDRVASLLSRLVHNAIEHGPSQRVIRITVRSVSDKAIIDVWNAGASLPTDRVPRLFQPFGCGDSPSTGRSRGLGLGLYLAREIAVAHGGQIEVESSAACGTTFRVTLPRSRG
jgi:signal transduction histidine kinase